MASAVRTDAALLHDPVGLADAYRSSRSIAELAQQVGVSATTVQRALKRHGIQALPRNRNRRPPAAQVLDDRVWLEQRYKSRTGVEIAAELGVSSRTVYAAMERHGIARRPEPGVLKLRRPELVDGDWLEQAVEDSSSAMGAGELGVSRGTVTTAYGRAGLNAASTRKLFTRGRRRQRPSPDELRAAWDSEGSLRGVGRRLGIAHSTAAVWLAEVRVFADSTPALSRSVLLAAIERQLSISDIAAENRISATTVRVDLHRQGLFDAHRLRHRHPSSQ